MFKIAKTLDDLIKVFSVRSIVFTEEQQIPFKEEFDGLDFSCMHILGQVRDEPIAAGRIRYLNNYAKLERIAVRKKYRGKGMGHKLVQFMIRTAKKRGYKTFKIHAQAHLVDFYKKHNFKINGKKFKEAGIDHYPMICRL